MGNICHNQQTSPFQLKPAQKKPQPKSKSRQIQQQYSMQPIRSSRNQQQQGQKYKQKQGQNQYQQQQLHQQNPDLSLTLTSQNSEEPEQVVEVAVLGGRPVNKMVQISEFDARRKLGKGAYGDVYLVTHKTTKKPYALKILTKQQIKNQQHVTNQRYLLQALDHPFLVKLHYAFQSRTKLYLLVDFMAGGELFYLLRRTGRFQESVARFYAAEILLALEYLHGRNVIYRDLKPQNVLLGKDGHIKLADFGVSKICFSRNQLAFSICGTPQYIAPEIIKGKGYDYTADWFSFGSLLYDMLTGKPPFYSKNKHKILYNLTKNQVPIPQYLSPQAKSLLKSLFKLNPKQRLGHLTDSQQIKSHQFFKSIDFVQLKQLKIKPPIRFDGCQQLNVDGFEFGEHGTEGAGGAIMGMGKEIQGDVLLFSQGKVGDDSMFKDFQYVKPELDTSGAFENNLQSVGNSNSHKGIEKAQSICINITQFNLQPQQQNRQPSLRRCMSKKQSFTSIETGNLANANINLTNLSDRLKLKRFASKYSTNNHSSNNINNNINSICNEKQMKIIGGNTSANEKSVRKNKLKAKNSKSMNNFSFYINGLTHQDAKPTIQQKDITISIDHKRQQQGNIIQKLQ